MPKVTLSFTSTRLYNCHHCIIETDSGIKVEGKCKYQNRTWESYNYRTAIMNAVYFLNKNTKIDPEMIEKIRQADSREEAINLIEALDI